jgi:NTP pyrophosphatase (non-canonical NTP hydrolase)
MQSDLIKFIKELSKNDRKTLSQKALKLAEETGELAKAALPFDNAHATNHRFVTSDKILEEVADVMLVAMSIAFDIGYDSEDIFSKMNIKSQVWANLQNREMRYTDRNPYEIHVSVEEASSPDSFRAACASLDVKPIMLDLQSQNSGIIKDVMTSSVFFGTNKGAHDEMERIAAGLTGSGFSVVRKKIETTPWHPAAPSEANKAAMPPNCYFESHLNVRLKPSQNNSRLLKEIADMHHAHLSRNIFKKYADGTTSVMITYREYTGTAEKFAIQVKHLHDALEANNFDVDKLITEFSVYDTNVKFDAEWTAPKLKNVIKAVDEVSIV